MKVRIKDLKSGKQFLQSLEEDMTINALKQLIQEKCSISPSLQQIKVGFPPQLISEDAAVVGDFVQNMDSILVETIEFEDTNEPIFEHNADHNPTTDPAPATIDSPEENPLVRVERHKVPDDNSCLFTAIGYLFLRALAPSPAQLRQIVASNVTSDPITFNAAILEKEPPEYAEWILRPKSWGGAIELTVFSQYFQAAVFAGDIRSGRFDCYGEDKNYSKCVYLLYDGLHYDALVMRHAMTGEEETVFETEDAVTQAAMFEYLLKLHKEKAFTDTHSFSVKCTECGWVGHGEADALKHAQEKGHSKFQENK
eukprot:GCRY01002857.1.p1 GENE.GCRY01002857.1~~GCRY01002857.1.p1  ORF type:complete len:311 (+),score=81.70 GCRY01002857.1:205-1137(+)